MDDFPRPQNAKANIDLQGWMYLFSDFMAKIAPHYNKSPEQFNRIKSSILDKLSEFKDKEDGLYKDISKNEKFD